jgi:hypothetical protein
VRRRLFSILLLLLAASGLRAQPDSLLQEGTRLHRQYRFEEAMELFARAAARTTDPDTLRLLRENAGDSQNALNMTDFCADPVVVARERFSRKDFFLFYPLKNQGWRLGPNALDLTESAFPTYAPKGDRTVYFSTVDAAGVRNLYVSRDQDTLWSAPALMGENLLSVGNEVFPMISADGKTLTFSSDGFHGMGGYDLYRSTWDDEAGTWGEPVNLGFPFSSPGDDFLMADSADGRYTLFASNRDCAADSVYIYVIERMDNPVRTPVRDPEALAHLCALHPLSDPARMDNGSAVSEAAPSNDDTRLYMLKMGEARALRDSIYAYERVLDKLRTALSEDPGDGRTALTASILEKETALAPLRKELEETNRTIRRIEQSFLQRGVVETSERADREVVGARSSYTFTKNALGAKLRMKVAAVPQRSGETFKVAPVGRFAQSTALPEGIVYQIELFTSPRHATLDEIRGLSPVYERLTSSLRYTYAVGQFRTFSEALGHLNEVRILGFPDARIVAYFDGKPVPVSDARRVQ